MATGASIRTRTTKSGARAAERSVILTGVCGRLGRLLLRQLHREGRVVGIDRRDFPDAPPDLMHYRLDIRRKACRDVFRREPAQAVVHLGVMHDPRISAETRHTWNVEGFGRVLEYVAAMRIPKLVLLSSAAVYGARPDNAQFLLEDAPLLASGRVSDIRDLVELDMLAQTFFWRVPECETVILRPSFIVGEVHNEIYSYFRLPITPRLLGFDPMMQFVHEADVVQALRQALRPGVRGIYNIGGPGVLPLSQVIARVGRPAAPVPHVLARGLLDRLWRLGFTDFPGREIDYLRYVCMVDDRRARRELGYAPRKSLDETVASIREAFGE
ncbi:MAG: NAD-dependent epimerase/dehydratase family protein [Deltaproteobacteria bacterium]|nr:NAD-dependent epimerase/dehydratase family protein [Deltaproteobacteria bacterium]